MLTLSMIQILSQIILFQTLHKKLIAWSNNYSKKITIKEESGYRTTFDGKVEWSFGNKNARNVVKLLEIFGVDNSSISQTDICKINFLVLHEGELLILMESLVCQKKSLVLTLVLSLYYNG